MLCVKLIGTWDLMKPGNRSIFTEANVSNDLFQHLKSIHQGGKHATIGTHKKRKKLWQRKGTKQLFDTTTTAVQEHHSFSSQDMFLEKECLQAPSSHLLPRYLSKKGRFIHN